MNTPTEQRASYYVLRNRSGDYYSKNGGFSATLDTASVVGRARAAQIEANAPSGTVEAIPVAGRPMLA